MSGASVEAVVFDWGGTLTPFHDVDLLDLWRAAARRLAPERAEEVAAALLAAEQRWWEEAVANGRSGTTHDVLRAAAAATGLDVPTELHDEALLAHLDAWTPHTRTLPEVAPLLTELRGRRVKIGLLSNTHWPRQWHEHWLARDGVLDLIDARVYTSDLPWLKPHRQAFDAVLAALGGVAPARAVFVGDRPLDDISGAKNAGMRAVLIPNNAVPGYDVVPDATIERLPDLLGVLAAW
ncbi:MAG: HAD family hydrolase [Frankiaceae bacterium]